MEFIVDQRAPGVDPGAFSDLFDRLIWLWSDNGAGVCNVLSAWLDGTDFYRVRVALGVEETFLFDDRGAMVDCFERLQARWPELDPGVLRSCMLGMRRCGTATSRDDSLR